MRLSEYQERAMETAIYPEQGLLGGLTYAVLSLNGEAGELANKTKKIIRDGDSPEKRAELRKELGGVLWYCAAVASELGVSLESVAAENLRILESRMERGVIGGSGDER